MNRRDFLKVLRTGTVALAVPGFAYAENPLEYPLTSRPDVGTKFNKQMAAKARKVARYIITKDDQKGLLHFDPKHRIGNDYQGVQAVMKIDDWRYTVWVANHDENADNNKMPDLVYVWMGPEGTSGQSKLIIFSDKGLDGRCDFGIIPKGLSETGQRIIYLAQDRYNPIAEGLQYQNRFQELYRKTLDKMVKFYERK